MLELAKDLSPDALRLHVSVFVFHNGLTLETNRGVNAKSAICLLIQ